MPHPSLPRRGRALRRAVAPTLGAVALMVLAAAAALEAHDFWLVPDAFQVAAGGTLQVRGQTSSRFPTSESAVALDRVRDVRVIAAGGEETPTDLSISGKSLLLRHRPRTEGQYAVVVALHPRSVRESAASFRRYLELEGAPEALARLDREGLLRGRDSVTRRYAKYAKTLVAVGSGGPRAFDRKAGHPLELVPESDPAALRAGDTLRVRLLYRGRPLGGIAVHAGAAGEDAATAAAAGSSSQPAEVHLTSDADGLVRVPVAAGGLWNVRTIHVVQSDAGSGADWDTHWATIVFQVRQAAGAAAAGSARAQGSDSAAVAGTVERYHRALADGDSAAALRLLTDDAVVLESGNVEPREQYRSHHLPADIAFARAVKSERGATRVTVRGDVAWAISTSSTKGEYRGRAIDSAGAELMVLVRGADGGWRIAAIHWSSRARRR